MSMHRIRMLTIMAATGGMVVALAAGSAASHAAGAVAWARATGAVVSVASPNGQFQQDMRGTPTLAVDPVKPDILVASANDLVDMQPCSKQASITAGTCSLPATASNGGSFNLGVGMSGAYFSFDQGHHWIQPTYHGLTAVGCNPTKEPCQAKPGLIHTVPNYSEKGLRSRGDASVAFGPVRRHGRFSWANGSRLYFSSLATNLTDTAIRPGHIDSSYTMTVSHIDDPTPARVADQSNWSKPVIVPKTEPAVSLPTEDQIWADDASSSRYFGRVYMCYNDFYFPATGNVIPIYPTVAVSSNGGRTWTVHHIAPPTDSASHGYHMGCGIRTDSHGTVYAFFTHFSGTFPSNELAAAQTKVKSSDGGATWTQPVDFTKINTGCYYFDPLGDRCAEEGPGGTPNELVPSVAIANGAPTGAGATNEIALAWSDGRFGLNHEASLLSYSTNGAKTWSAPAKVSLPGDRTLHSAVAIAPDGSRMYLTYTAFTTPFTMTTSTPRLLHGVLRSAAVGPGGAPSDWTTDYVGRSGDARGTGFADYNYEELLGFYISAIATRTYGAGVWADVSRTADCPAIDAWREASLKALQVITPAPWPLADCPANFGNADIMSATTAP
jgi:hypothetical protein